MVSFWPFKSSEDAASFERTLSTLSGKITRAAARNDRLRQRSRRVRVMWTLYAGFAYILIGVILILIIGYQKWGRSEYSVVTGGPLLLYVVRTALTRYYDYRVSSTDAYIKNLTKERDATIERLKEATKYNSTQQLLEKYGNSPKTKAPAVSPAKSKAQASQSTASASGPRTGIVPPPTANIQRVNDPRQTTLQRPTSAGSAHNALPPPAGPPPDAPAAEFAPNAYSAAELTRQYSSATAATFTQAHWYDRILDALLGEDETQPKNRLALICSECRLVNGQAPPGARNLGAIGRWRCGGCRAWNGKENSDEDAVSRLVQGWEEQRKAQDRELNVRSDDGEDFDQREMEYDIGSVAAGNGSSDIDAADESVNESPAPSRSTRSKSKIEGRK